jgi:site-specific recombinase XerD
MTNEEVVRKVHEEFALRGMSQQTEETYLCAMRLFLRYHEDRPIETMGEPEIREFPAIMSKYEIIRLFSVIDNLQDKAMFETVYGAGLRVSEIVHLRVQDIDSKQMRIFVHHGKGGKDRFTLLSQRNLDILREYWKQYRPNHPEGYLFYARSRDKHTLTSRSVDNAFNKYKTTY